MYEHCSSPAAVVTKGCGNVRKMVFLVWLYNIIYMCHFIPANLIFSASSGDIYTFWSIVRSKHEVASTTVVFVGSTVPNGTRGGIITT